MRSRSASIPKEDNKKLRHGGSDRDRRSSALEREEARAQAPCAGSSVAAATSTISAAELPACASECGADDGNMIRGAANMENHEEEAYSFVFHLFESIWTALCALHSSFLLFATVWARQARPLIKSCTKKKRQAKTCGLFFVDAFQRQFGPLVKWVNRVARQKKAAWWHKMNKFRSDFGRKWTAPDGPGNYCRCCCEVVESTVPAFFRSDEVLYGVDLGWFLGWALWRARAVFHVLPLYVIMFVLGCGLGLGSALWAWAGAVCGRESVSGREGGRGSTPSPTSSCAVLVRAVPAAWRCLLSRPQLFALSTWNCVSVLSAKVFSLALGADDLPGEVVADVVTSVLLVFGASGLMGFSANTNWLITSSVAQKHAQSASGTIVPRDRSNTARGDVDVDHKNNLPVARKKSKDTRNQLGEVPQKSSSSSSEPVFAVSANFRRAHMPTLVLVLVLIREVLVCVAPHEPLFVDVTGAPPAVGATFAPFFFLLILHEFLLAAWLSVRFFCCDRHEEDVDAISVRDGAHSGGVLYDSQSPGPVGGRRTMTPAAQSLLVGDGFTPEARAAAAGESNMATGSFGVGSLLPGLGPGAAGEDEKKKSSKKKKKERRERSGSKEAAGGNNAEPKLVPSWSSSGVSTIDHHGTAVPAGPEPRDDERFVSASSHDDPQAQEGRTEFPDPAQVEGEAFRLSGDALAAEPSDEELPRAFPRRRSFRGFHGISSGSSSEDFGRRRSSWGGSPRSRRGVFLSHGSEKARDDGGRESDGDVSPTTSQSLACLPPGVKETLDRAMEEMERQARDEGQEDGGLGGGGSISTDRAAPGMSDHLGIADRGRGAAPLRYSRSTLLELRGPPGGRVLSGRAGPLFLSPTSWRLRSRSPLQEVQGADFLSGRMSSSRVLPGTKRSEDSPSGAARGSETEVGTSRDAVEGGRRTVLFAEEKGDGRPEPASASPRGGSRGPSAGPTKPSKPGPSCYAAFSAPSAAGDSNSLSKATAFAGSRSCSRPEPGAGDDQCGVETRLGASDQHGGLGGRCGGDGSSPGTTPYGRTYLLSCQNVLSRNGFPTTEKFPADLCLPAERGTGDQYLVGESLASASALA